MIFSILNLTSAWYVCHNAKEIKNRKYQNYRAKKKYKKETLVGHNLTFLLKNKKQKMRPEVCPIKPNLVVILVLANVAKR